MRTIQELNTLVEELEKRIKSISDGQSFMSNLSSIKAYLLNMQNFLQDLLQAYQTHDDKCEQNTKAINTLTGQVTLAESQITTLNQQIDEILLDIENLNNSTTSINSSINQHSEKITEINDSLLFTKADVTQIGVKLQNFLGESTTTLASLEEQINSLNQTSTNLNQDVSTLKNWKTTTTTTIDNINTSINNLTDNYTTLQENQISIENSISEMQTDITNMSEQLQTNTTIHNDFENRLNKIETQETPTFNVGQSYTVNINRLCEQSIFYSRYVTCITDQLSSPILHVCVTYSSERTDEFSMGIFDGNTRLENIAIDLTKYPNKFDCYIPLTDGIKYHDLAAKFTTCLNITLEKVQYDLIAKNTVINQRINDYTVHCFNNQIYLTKVNTDSYDYGKFTADNVSLTGFSNNITAVNPLNTTLTRFEFIPYTTVTDGVWSEPVDAFVSQRFDSKTDVYVIDYETLENSVSKYHSNFVTDVEYNFGIYSDFNHWGIQNSKPILCKNTARNSFVNLDELAPGEWGFVTAVKDNNRTTSSPVKPVSEMECVALKNDGYFYLLPEQTLTYVVKIGFGNYASAYRQPDDSINVYITNAGKVTKYKLTKNSQNQYEITSTSEISTTTRVYELLNNKILKFGNRKWSIATLQY